MVTHPGTNPAWHYLTSVIRQEQCGMVIDNISQNLIPIEFVPPLENIFKKTWKINKNPRAQGIPKWSPIQVLPLPDFA